MKGILFFLNILSVVALVLSYLSPSISPHSFYLPQLVALGYKYLLIVNLFFIVLWAIWDWKKMGYSLLAIILGYSYIPRAYNWVGEQKEETQSCVSVLSFNVQRFGMNTLKKNSDDMFKLIRNKSTGIACFQEYSHNGYVSFGKKYLDSLYKHIHISKRKREVATFSKFPIINRKEIPFPNSKMATGIFSDVVIKEDTVRVFNVHLESNLLSEKNKKYLENLVNNKDENYKNLKYIGSKLRRSSLKRAKQIDLLGEYIDASPYEVIVCGDFNDVPMSYSYQQIYNRLKDSFLQSGFGEGLTFREGVIKVRIDYIFSSKKAMSYEVENATFSDHFPIKSVLNLE